MPELSTSSTARKAQTMTLIAAFLGWRFDGLEMGFPPWWRDHRGCPSHRYGCHLVRPDRPNCKLGFDAWSPALRGESLYDSAKMAAPHTIITTNADYIKVPRHRYRPELVNYERQEVDWVRAVPFGTGFIDYSAFFNGLKDGGFDGIATFEMCSPLRGGGLLGNLDACAAGCLKWMREHRHL